MGNIKRYYEANTPYFVTTVTKERVPLFQNYKLCRILLVTIEYHKTVFDFTVQGYCLMPDHLHLILTSNGKFDLSFIMKMVKGSFTRKVNKLEAKNGSLWQRRFYDEAIRSEEQLRQQLEYIHQNPVKAGLATNASEYLLSSFAFYHGATNLQDKILTIEPIETH